MSDDLIKRSDAIKVVSTSCGTCLARDSKDCEKCSVSKLSELINAIPSADRPQGEWIHDYHFGLALPEHKCSVCGEWEYSDTESNYCPNCGARMKGVENENEM